MYMSDFVEFAESNETILQRQVRAGILELRRLKGRRTGRRPRPSFMSRIAATKGLPNYQRKPVGGPDANRDVVERLNYIASQLPGACKKSEWGSVHAGTLQEAAREIRRLRSVVYASRGEPLGSRPLMQFVGPPGGSNERAAWLGSLTNEEREVERTYGFPVVRYELDAVRLRREVPR